jgi:flagellar hook-associated protein 2
MASVDGLVSGLDTTTIISQLMQLERQPQTRLKAKQATVESAIGALRNLNTKFLAVTTAAGKLTDPKGWALATATSSDATKVAVTATAGAAQGNLSFSVTQLAAAGSYLSVGTVTKLSGAGFEQVVPEGTKLHLQKGDGTPVEIDAGEGSLAAVMKAVNASSLGVSATAVQLTSGQYTLKLESTTTGKNTAVRLGLTPGANDVLGGTTELVKPAEAQLKMGSTTITRESNTISDLLPGVTLTLLKKDAVGDPPTTVSVTADAEKVAGQVSALVDAVNAVTSDIKAVTGYNVDTGNKGKLYGDGAVRSLRDRLTSVVTGPGTSAAGVSIDRNGVVTFDKDTFLKALAADPAAVQKALGAGTPAAAGPPAVPAKPGLAGRLNAVADGASRSATADGGSGLIASAISSRESQVKTLRTSISGWDGRLEQREATLKRTYAALEKALGASQSQGQWLAGQIAGLPRWS